MHIKFKITKKEGISTPQVLCHEEHDPSWPHLCMIPGTYKTTKHAILRDLEA